MGEDYTGEGLYPHQESQVNSEARFTEGELRKPDGATGRLPSAARASSCLCPSSVYRKGERKWARNVLKQ